MSMSCGQAASATGAGVDGAGALGGLADGEPDAELADKLDRLRRILADEHKVAVAFSGGVDSSLLLVMAVEMLGDNALAVTECSKLVPDREIAAARAFCESRGIRHILFERDPLGDERVRANGGDRCYWCKRGMLSAIPGLLEENGFAGALVAEGSNLDDMGDMRPGRRAVEELGVASPLLQAGMTKADVRALARWKGLEVWDKPSAACLASRIPCGEGLTAEKLALVDAAERELLDRGFRQVRVRLGIDHAPDASARPVRTGRIEIPPGDFARFMQGDNPAQVESALRRLGFDFVALDLGGYRTGKLNRPLLRSD